MKLTEISIKKPVAVIMITIAAIFLGVMGWLNLGSDLMPKANIPVVSITTIYPGAGAQEIEKDIVKPIEDAVSVISGVDKVWSTASEGFARVTIMFKLSVDATTCVIDTQKAIDSIAGKLPKEASKPTIYKFDDSETPILTLTLSGDKPFETLYDQADKIKQRLEAVEGVGNVSIFGGKEKELIIKLDKTKLEYYNLTIPQIVGRIQADNINFPGGTIYQLEQYKSVRIVGEFTSINELKSLRIPSNGSFAQLGDIAEISLDYPNMNEIARINGRTAVGLDIKKQSDANIVQTGNRVKEEINKIIPTLKGTELKLVTDNTIFITSSLKDTTTSLFEGILTTAIILFLFLRQGRSVLIVLCAIPTSLVSTYFMMYLCGFTLNMLSLMGLALCIGILVDDSIVILENIHRHIKMGKETKTAALDGRSEIGMAAIAITLSDVVVFAPIAFMSGMIGQYFKQFGLTVVFATLVSLLVSFTLTPMLASRLFKEKAEKKNKKEGIFSKVGSTALILYSKLLIWSMNNRAKVVVFILLLIAGGVSLIPLKLIGSEFMPRVDEGKFAVSVSLSQGASIQSTDTKIKIVEEYIKKIPELDYYYTNIGGGNLPSEARVFVQLVGKKSRDKTTKQIVDEVREWGTENITGVNFNVADMQSVGGIGYSKPIQLNIRGPKVEVIKEIAAQAEEIIKKTEGTIDIGNSFKNGNPEFNIMIDRLAAANYGFSVYDAANTVRTGIEGMKAGVYRADGEDYDIRVKLDSNQVMDENDIGNLKVSNSIGQIIPLSQIADVRTEQGPTVINKNNKQRVITVSSNIKNGYVLGGITSQIQKELQKISLPDGYTFSFDGEQQNMQDSFKSLIQVIIISFLLVYMILVILYESFLTPFVRILALPVASIGAFSMLAITHNSLNIMTMIGLIMLEGLSAKNGTLLIDYTNTLMVRGLSLREALYQAGTTRLKPIWMTSLTMIVGMLPSALAVGDGSEFKKGMALALIGGMITSTILSPILLPVVYTIIDDFRNYFIKKLFNKKSDIVEQTM